MCSHMCARVCVIYIGVYMFYIRVCFQGLFIVSIAFMHMSTLYVCVCYQGLFVASISFLLLGHKKQDTKDAFSRWRRAPYKPRQNANSAYHCIWGQLDFRWCSLAMQAWIPLLPMRENTMENGESLGGKTIAWVWVGPLDDWKTRVSSLTRNLQIVSCLVPRVAWPIPTTNKHKHICKYAHLNMHNKYNYLNMHYMHNP